MADRRITANRSPNVSSGAYDAVGNAAAANARPPAERVLQWGRTADELIQQGSEANPQALDQLVLELRDGVATAGTQAWLDDEGWSLTKLCELFAASGGDDPVRSYAKLQGLISLANVVLQAPGEAMQGLSLVVRAKMRSAFAAQKEGAAVLCQSAIDRLFPAQAADARGMGPAGEVPAYHPGMFGPRSSARRRRMREGLSRTAATSERRRTTSGGSVIVNGNGHAAKRPPARAARPHHRKEEARAANWIICERYRKGQVGRDDVLRMTTSVINRNKSGWAEALSCLKQMGLVGVQPNVIVYNAAISACEKGERPDEALKLLDEMKTAGVKPDVITYSAAISACEKGRRTDEALKLLAEMKAAGVMPDVITYNAAISACEKGGRTDEALKLLAEMKTARVIARCHHLQRRDLGVREGQAHG